MDVGSRGESPRIYSKRLHRAFLFGNASVHIQFRASYNICDGIVDVVIKKNIGERYDEKRNIPLNVYTLVLIRISFFLERILCLK